MRMWMVDPKILCMQHLVGEHGEIHKHRHNFVKEHSIAGRIEGNACEPTSMKTRHDELETELRLRATHAGRKPPHSPYNQPDISYLPEKHRKFQIDRSASLQLLITRCRDCRDRYEYLQYDGNIHT